jgi:hypothetical protein
MEISAFKNGRRALVMSNELEALKIDIIQA